MYAKADSLFLALASSCRYQTLKKKSVEDKLETEDILAMNLIIFHSRETLSLLHFDTMPVFPLISLIRLCFVLII